MLRAEFDRVKKDRDTLEKSWLESLRRFKGQYSKEMFDGFDVNQSKVFVKLTRNKCVTAIARIGDALFATGEKNWEIKPTPVPDVASDERILKIIAGISTQQPTVDIVERELSLQGEKITSRMSLEIEDQLAEIDYEGMARKVIQSAVIYGTGFNFLERCKKTSPISM